MQIERNKLNFIQTNARRNDIYVISKLISALLQSDEKNIILFDN